MYFMDIIVMIWNNANFYNVILFVQRTLIWFQKSFLNRNDHLLPLYFKKDIIHTFFNLLSCLSWHHPVLFCRFKGIIQMLQNLLKGETNNLGELKKNLDRLFWISTYTFFMHTEKRIADISMKRFEFTGGVRGFHIYRDIWLRYINKTLKCLHELGNAYDVFAIKCMKGNMIVGHLPGEISKPTKCL